MDPKATAKSKRIHSFHGRRNHQHHHPSPVSSSAQKNKSPAAAGEEKPRRSNALPSNWDRYDDGGDTGGEEQAGSVPALPTEIAPKSIGADYSYLLEQARSQSDENRSFSSDLFASEEIPFDLMLGSRPMLCARGESILSWCNDDNFIIDDDTSSNYEVPFLSMDLNKLALQLSKLSLSKKLFIEEDLLFEDLQSLSKSKDETEKTDQSEPSIPPDDLSEVEREKKFSLSTRESIQGSSSWPIQDFNASEAKSELDKLLDSFGEISKSTPQNVDIAIEIGSTFESSTNHSLDDALDDLLAESSTSVQDLNSTTSSTITTTTNTTDTTILSSNMVLSANISCNSETTKPVDDFDSWFYTL